MKIPKFHDRKSLMGGILAGLFLIYSGMFHSVPVIGIIQMVIGGILAIHCFDMLKYWKKHQIVRIVKSDTERVVWEKDAKQDTIWG